MDNEINIANEVLSSGKKVWDFVRENYREDMNSGCQKVVILTETKAIRFGMTEHSCITIENDTYLKAKEKYGEVLLPILYGCEEFNVTPKVKTFGTRKEFENFALTKQVPIEDLDILYEFDSSTSLEYIEELQFQDFIKIKEFCEEYDLDVTECLLYCNIGYYEGHFICIDYSR